MRPRLLCLAAVLVAQSLSAQPTQVPARPRLPVGADTNQAQAYYQFGRANPKWGDAGRFRLAALVDPEISGAVATFSRAEAIIAGSEAP